MEKLNAKKKYIDIIKRARSDNRVYIKGHSHYHHILPISLFPRWEKRPSNIIILSHDEHRRCHELTFTIWPSREMAYAFMRCKGWDEETLIEVRKFLSEGAKKSWKNPEIRRKRIESRKKYENSLTELEREQRSIKYIEIFSDPNCKEKRSNSAKIRMNQPEQRKKSSLQMKKWRNQKETKQKLQEYWKSKECSDKCRESTINLWQDEKYKIKVTKKIKEYWMTDEAFKKQSEASKRSWQSDEYREKIKVIHSSEEYKLKQKARWFSTNDGRQFLTTADAAKNLGLSRSMIKYLLKNPHKETKKGLKLFFLSSAT